MFENIHDLALQLVERLRAQRSTEPHWSAAPVEVDAAVLMASLLDAINEGERETRSSGARFRFGIELCLRRDVKQRPALWVRPCLVPDPHPRGIGAQALDRDLPVRASFDRRAMRRWKGLALLVAARPRPDVPPVGIAQQRRESCTPAEDLQGLVKRLDR